MADLALVDRTGARRRARAHGHAPALRAPGGPRRCGVLGVCIADFGDLTLLVPATCVCRSSTSCSPPPQWEPPRVWKGPPVGLVGRAKRCRSCSAIEYDRVVGSTESRQRDVRARAVCLHGGDGDDDAQAKCHRHCALVGLPMQLWLLWLAPAPDRTRGFSARPRCSA